MTSKTGMHAIRSLLQLGLLSDGEFAGAAALASEIDAPANYLGKLLQSMAHEGIVESRKGLGGGFRLARDPGTITLQEVLEPIDHISKWEGCFLGLPSCSDETACAVHDRWAGVRDRYLAMLAETTIGDLVASYRHHEGASDPV